jgi:hypothetical protein
MIIREALLIGMVCSVLTVIAACTQVTATPVTIVETVVVRETVPVEKVVQQVVTKEIEKVYERVVPIEIEKEVVVFETVEVEKLVPVVETVQVIEYINVEVVVTPTPRPTPSRTPIPTIDLTIPIVDEVSNRITLVQHHYDRTLEYDWFTCASRGHGLNGVELDPHGPRFVGPNSQDFDLWGVVALFKVCPDGSIFLVPQQTGGRFLDPDGIEHESFTLEEALQFFAGGDAIWIGTHGEAGRIGACDPQYKTPTPVSGR